MTPQRARLFQRTVITAVLVAAVWVLGPSGRAAAPKFYSDDPIWTDPETQDASGVNEIDLSEQYDYVENSFLGAGDRAQTRAVNVNTVDEVPDSSWFTNRMGRLPLTLEQLTKGPGSGTGPAPGAWTIVSGKTEGIAPGFTMRDTAGQIYFIKFDPPSNPEMASGAEVIATKFLYAFGYHVPENYVASITRDMLVIDPGATVIEDGRRRPMTPRDLDIILKKAARSPDGSYRTLASKGLEGKPVGPFRYYGTRPDDPNDIFSHEHRRELRGLAVFSSWLNHDDSRAINTLDTLVRHDNRTVVRHHLIDFGSTFGSGSTRAQSPRAGNEFIWESRPTLITMLTLGFYVRPWIKVDYPDLPAVGRFESTYFRPEDWKPEYANPAFLNARPEDRFWAARIISAFSDEAIRAIVGTARFSEPRATEYLADTVIERKRKILTSWLNGSSPIVDPSLTANGELTFGNAAEEAGVASAADRYTIQWSAFDNASGTHQAAGDEQTVNQRGTTAPASLLATRPEYISARLRAFHREHPAWSQPLALYFRRAADGWTLVGVERNP
jgi:hypothetical protein